jgi:hypothetical protein
MDKNNPPESFGIFKPVGWIVITLRTAPELDALAQTLADHGFAPDALVRYTPAEMLAQIDSELPNASPLAEFGQEIRIVKAHRVLAQNGCSFLVVHAPDDQSVAQVAAAVRDCGAPTAQRYGRLIIEELTERSASEVPFASSTGLGPPDDATLAPTRGAALPGPSSP